MPYVRKAKKEELCEIMRIYRMAQDFMISTGNPNQWRHAHPVRELIESDIERGICHVICGGGALGEEILGVFALCEGEDPTYGYIEDGQWLNNGPYVTIHRIASARKQSGIFKCAADYCKGLADNVRVDTHKDNAVMQNVLKKNGFRKCGIIYLASGDPRIAYQWSRTMENNYTIRPERPEDYREVEGLVRESFWNVYKPGCSEHFVLHVLRDDPAFVKELDFVMEQDGRIIGQNMFMKTLIEADDGRTVDVLTMGPICITPGLKRKGYGKILLDYSLEKAAEMGFGAVLFEGNIDFYGKSGFSFARNFGIRYHDLPEDADDSFFLCRELIPGYLGDVTGVYQTPQGYYVDDADVDEFDKSFPPKEKLKLPGQLFE